uniref:Uncharacterized protein n=1 Tax=Anguilla anguilla TaxID=7936 RepID=A0A0E9XSN8_ANGAN
MNSITVLMKYEPLHTMKWQNWKLHTSDGAVS